MMVLSGEASGPAPCLKGNDMNANQRSESNNQTNNGANEKGLPGSKGNTTDGPMDHTYPQGAAPRQGQGGGAPAEGGAVDSGAYQGGGRDGGGRADLPGGSMQSQQTGGTGPVQGITDSHQQQMQQRSGAFGQLEQPVGGRSDQQGTRGGGQHGPQSSVQSVQGGSMGASQGATPSGTWGGGQAGRQNPGKATPQGGATGTGSSVDRAGTQTGSSRQSADGAEQSNDSAGGLPRSPGNSGPSGGPRDTHLTGAQIHADQQAADGVHDSNDAAGAYPKSPGGANKLAADENMDDDTGFSNRG
jgi:hypothetical protein